MNVFQSSVFSRKVQNDETKNDAKIATKDSILSLRKTALSCDYILLVTWLSVVNLSVYFLVNTWAQYTRYVDENSYHRLVDLFGEFAWVGAIFCVCVGAIIDAISNRLQPKYYMNTGKTPFFWKIHFFTKFYPLNDFLTAIFISFGSLGMKNKSSFIVFLIKEDKYV